jgi:hypothetical protein
VKPVAPNRFVLVGVLHFYLQTVSQGAAVRGEDGVLTYLTNYLEHLQAAGFLMTTTAVWRLNGVREELETLEDDAAAAGLSVDHAKRINLTAYEARETLYAEARATTVYEVTPKKFDVNKLLYDVGGLMRNGYYDELPLLAVIDIDEAGKCIAFERATAAAFHTLRATEGVLRHYYTCYAKRKRIRKPWNWNPMLDDLSQRRKKPPKPLLDQLDAIRENFRNPTQHPEKLYDVEEAQDAFAQCLDAISRMVGDENWTTPDDAWVLFREGLAAEADEPEVGSDEHP